MTTAVPIAAHELIARGRALGVSIRLFDLDGSLLHGSGDEAGALEELAALARTCDPYAPPRSSTSLADGRRAVPIVLQPPRDRALAAIAVLPPANDDLERVLRWMASDLERVEEQQFAIEDMSDQLVRTYEQVMAFYRIGRSMNVLDDPRLFIEFTCRQVREVLEYDWVAVCYVRSPLAIAGLERECIVSGQLPCPSDRFAALARHSIGPMSHDDWTAVWDPDQHELATLAGTQIVLEPVVFDDVIIGAVLAGGKAGDDPEVSSVDTQLLDTVADLLGVFHQNVTRYEVQRTLFMGTVSALSASIDAKHPYTHGHSKRVAYLAAALAEAIGLPANVVERVYIAGIVHDVGKIGVSEATLSKPGRLTDDEFAEIKRHPVIGYEILKGIPPMQDILPGVLHHHERWDGRGYPHGLAGEDIPLFGRLIAVADAFDAMSSTRSYRDELPRAEVLRRLREGAGAQWEARLVDAFMQLDLSGYDSLMANARQAGAVTAAA